ncbi:N-acetylmuramoyl-L-alanine amidase [Clostridium sp. Marseille-P299]|uniref:N-acetylmuramoyl-L-alanine amidase n=1 Tax=Clostridium sp. Marseille-P299 TaxID=1805477 RepID=UPI000829E247|nr:N-acetylmuramoyl-L-alanine amidase [Clostridium sp. Marseille-P299]
MHMLYSKKSDKVISEMKVVLDAGHGGFDEGIVHEGRKEKDDNLDLALAVGKLLKEKGIDVGYTRVSDVYEAPIRKAQIANDQKADLLVSLHRNFSSSSYQYSGVESLIYKRGSISEQVAEEINKRLENVGFQNLGVVVKENPAILRRTEMPAILVRVGSIYNAADNELFDEKFDQVADAIAGGIYKGVTGNEWVSTLQKENITEEVQTSAIEGKYLVQFSLFQEQNNAERFVNSMIDIGYPLRIAEKGAAYVVEAADIETLVQAKSLELDLNMLGYDTIVMFE